MAVPPKYAGHKLLFANPPTTASAVPHSPHTLELFLDYACPFSAKLFNTFTTAIAPLIRENPAWGPNLEVVFRQQIQPWHPSSTLLHESALAVLRLSPERFWQYSELLFKEQKSYFDVSVVNETRNQTYKRLAALAGQVGVDEAEVYKLLEISDKPAEDGSLNLGNGVTNDVKFVTKVNRLTGVHVTPTGVLDGVVVDLGSAWGVKEWTEWLTKVIV